MPETTATIRQLRIEYEKAVQSIASSVAGMRARGLDEEYIARSAHKERQRVTLAYKELTPEPLRSKIVQRTIEEYGQATGPSVEFLRRSEKSWAEIADGASRPGPGIPT